MNSYAADRSVTLAFCAARRHICAARQCDLRITFPPPSLGVSSLDLGRLHPQAALFLKFAGFAARTPRRRASAPLNRGASEGAGAATPRTPRSEKGEGAYSAAAR